MRRLPEAPPAQDHDGHDGHDGHDLPPPTDELPAIDLPAIDVPRQHIPEEHAPEHDRLPGLPDPELPENPGLPAHDPLPANVAHLPDAELDPDAGGALVETDRSFAPRSSLRRLAPLAVGAVAVLVATVVLTFAGPSDEGPDLAAALVSSDTAQARQEATTTAPPTSSALSTVGSSALADAARAARERATTTTRPPTATTTDRPAAGAGRAATSRPAAPSPAGNGTQAATAKGWQLVGGDEFNGGMSSHWGPYDGAGHGGNGRRTPDAISVENGSLVIRGDSNGNTGGMAWDTGQRYGKWEMRAKFPAGDKQYHPVLILWPTDMSWPEGGEVDFAETDSAADDVSFFLHYSSSNQQKYAKTPLDITQWHNYAVEWTPDAVRGYIDGKQVFESTDGETLPPGKMHPTIQLDYFPDGGSPKPTEMLVDWMRIYK
ncbi:MAG: glycoside hydrolase family 16 protein [Pseudonocardia sp.]|nr:glycoside hydrolase family 16 protein [Pseudonocardia sp.]